MKEPLNPRGGNLVDRIVDDSERSCAVALIFIPLALVLVALQLCLHPIKTARAVLSATKGKDDERRERIERK